MQAMYYLVPPDHPLYNTIDLCFLRSKGVISRSDFEKATNSYTLFM